MKQYKVEILNVKMNENSGIGHWNTVGCSTKTVALDLVKTLKEEKRTFTYIIVDGAEVDLERYIQGVLVYKNGKDIK